MAAKEPSERKTRKHLSQVDVPAYSLNDALRVAEVLRDEYAKEATNPIDVARVLEMGPKGTTFKMLTGAAVAYGLITGGARAKEIALDGLGRRIVAPTEEGDDLLARREAALHPRVLREFLTRYDGSPLPSKQVALNVLEQMGVPANATERAHQMTLRNAEAVGFLVEIKGRRYVRLDAAPDVVAITASDESVEEADEPYLLEEAPAIHPLASPLSSQEMDRVFVTHGSNKAIVGQIKEILSFGKLTPIVSVERESTAKPVPEKVLDDMRSCYAGIVHVGTESIVIDQNGDEHRMLNPNVLIEIGAAMALYQRRFVLLVEKGVTLPSNLQGLYEVRYEGDKLDYEATMKLLKAFNEFQKAA